MATYYAVTSTFDDRGNVTAKLTASVQASKCPNGCSSSTATKDIYVDWFASKREAKEFIESVKAA